MVVRSPVQLALQQHACGCAQLQFVELHNNKRTGVHVPFVIFETKALQVLPQQVTVITAAQHPFICRRSLLSPVTRAQN